MIARMQNFRSGSGDGLQRVLVAAAVVASIVIIGVVDYATGVEVRIYPLYFLPISLAAWRLKRRDVLAAAALSTISWAVSNYIAGMYYIQGVIWGVNILAQGASFVLVGLLIAAVRGALDRERELSRTDPLTSLLNSRGFYNEATRILSFARRYKRPLTVAYVDLDNFKAVNDTMGHKAGDEVLRTVAAVLRNSIRKSDIGARLGGDEFVLLLPETGPDQARVVLDRMMTAITETFGGTQHPITASVGVVSFFVAPSDVEVLVHEADGRMYAAKTAGSNRIDLVVVGEPHEVPLASNS